MATHNYVRGVGFLLGHPKILNEGVEGEEKILFSIRTVHRDLDDYIGMKYQDLMIYYDGLEMMEKMKKLTQFDIVDIKGVFNVLTMNKHSTCSNCGNKNIKYNGSSTFIYPIALTKLNGMQEAYERDNTLPERVLEKHFIEVSNEVMIVGTVVNEPELLKLPNTVCCKYQLGVDRKYYIKTQGEITADYPWVYSYGKQAELDLIHLQKGTLVLINGFIQNRKVKAYMDCKTCGKSYLYPDVATEFIPYSVEYLNNYITDEEIAEKKSEG